MSFGDLRGRIRAAFDGLADLVHPKVGPVSPKEQELLTIGERNAKATRAFRAHEIPDQVASYGNRCFIDPFEYVIKPDDKVGAARLLSVAEVRHQRYIESTDTSIRKSIEAGIFPGETFDDVVATRTPVDIRGLFDIIVGSPHKPRECTRYTVCKAEQSENPSLLKLYLELPFDREKSNLLVIPVKPGLALTDSEPNRISLLSTNEPPPITPDSTPLVPEEIEILNSGLKVGFGRTGGNILHQRKPPGATSVYPEMFTWKEFDLRSEKVWVVAADFNEMKENFDLRRARNSPNVGDSGRKRG